MIQWKKFESCLLSSDVGFHTNELWQKCIKMFNF